MYYLYVNDNGDYIISSRPNHNNLTQVSADESYHDGLSLVARWWISHTSRSKLYSMVLRGNKNGGLALHVIKGDPIIEMFKDIPQDDMLDEPQYIVPSKRETNVVQKHLPYWKQKKNGGLTTRQQDNSSIKSSIPPDTINNVAMSSTSTNIKPSRQVVNDVASSSKSKVVKPTVPSNIKKSVATRGNSHTTQSNDDKQLVKFKHDNVEYYFNPNDTDFYYLNGTHISFEDVMELDLQQYYNKFMRM